MTDSQINRYYFLVATTDSVDLYSKGSYLKCPFFLITGKIQFSVLVYKMQNGLLLFSFPPPPPYAQLYVV